MRIKVYVTVNLGQSNKKKKMVLTDLNHFVVTHILTLRHPYFGNRCFMGMPRSISQDFFVKLIVFAGNCLSKM